MPAVSRARCAAGVPHGRLPSTQTRAQQRFTRFPKPPDFSPGREAFTPPLAAASFVCRLIPTIPLNNDTFTIAPPRRCAGVEQTTTLRRWSAPVWLELDDRVPILGSSHERPSQ